VLLSCPCQQAACSPCQALELTMQQCTAHLCQQHAAAPAALQTAAAAPGSSRPSRPCRCASSSSRRTQQQQRVTLLQRTHSSPRPHRASQQTASSSSTSSRRHCRPGCHPLAAAATPWALLLPAPKQLQQAQTICLQRGSSSSRPAAVMLPTHSLHPCSATVAP
jgi:hypothetical protein